MSSARRFVVDEMGPKSFGVRDTRTQLTVHVAFTRGAAKTDADRREQRHPIARRA